MRGLADQLSDPDREHSIPDAGCFESDEFNHHSVVYTFITNGKLRTRMLGYVAWELATAGILPGIQTAFNL